MIHYITPQRLTFEQIETILSKKAKLALSEESKKLINDCKAYLDNKIKRSEKPLYGITTGFGSLCKISISEADLSQLQANLVMSHACSVGNPINQDIIRLMLLLKAHALSLGKSGVQLITVERTSYIDRHGMKQNGNNLYTILPIQQATDAFYLQQLDRLESPGEHQRVTHA